MRLLGDAEHCLVEIKSLTQEQKGTITQQAILDSTEDFIFAYDKQYRLVHYNEATRRLWAAQGVNLKLYANLPEELSDEAWGALKPIVDAALAGETITLEYPFQFPGEGLKYYSVTYTPVYDHENQVTGTVGYARDITQRVEAEQQLAFRTAELERKHAEMCAFLDNLPLGVYILLPDGKPYYANTYTLKLFDYLSSDLQDPGAVSRSPLQTESLQDIAAEINVLKAGTLKPYPVGEMPIGRALAGEYSYVDDMLIQRPLGPMRLEVIGSPVFDEQGQLKFAMAVFSDISERKEQERALAQKNEELLAQQQELIDR
jgi:rsbT co-antagonist protein RsbR